MADKRTRRVQAIAENKVQGARGSLIRIPAQETRALSKDLPDGIRVLTTGKYQARYRGADKKEVAGNFDSLADAKDWRTKGLASVSGGEWITPKAGKQNVTHFYSIFLSSKGTRKASTRASTAELWDNHVSAWSDYQVSKIMLNEVEDWVKALAAAGYSQSLVRRCVLTLHGIMDEALRHNALKNNPVNLTRLKTLYPRASEHKPNPLSRDELDSLLEHSSNVYRDLTEFMARTGLRISEARELRVKDLRLSGKSVTGLDYKKFPMLVVERACVEIAVRVDGDIVKKNVNGKSVSVYEQIVDTPKSGARMVPLTPMAVLIANRVSKEKLLEDLLFVSSNGARVGKRGFGTSLNDAAARGQVVTSCGQSVTPHSLRDTFATQALLSGASVIAVSRALGHRDPSMTLTRYAGLLPEDTEALRTGLAVAERLHASQARGKS